LAASDFGAAAGAAGAAAFGSSAVHVLSGDAALAAAVRSRVTRAVVAGAGAGAAAAFGCAAGVPGIVRPRRYGRGSWARPSTRVSKCRCGPLQRPVQPT
jgi:hypothetical protein